MSRRRSLSDPLTLAALPPANETPLEKERRVRQEIEAKRISDAIDEQIKQERAAAKKRKEVKILLLGQSESGKSTTLKQFQLLYSPNAFHSERYAWRGIIYLNLVRSIRRVVEAISNDFEANHNEYDDDDDGAFISAPPMSPSRRDFSNSSPKSLISGSPEVSILPPARHRSSLSIDTKDKLAQFEAVKARLAPLLSLEDVLIKMLSGEAPTSGPGNGNGYPPQSPTHGSANQYPNILSPHETNIPSTPTSPTSASKNEVFVRSNNSSWKSALGKLRGSGNRATQDLGMLGMERDDPDDPAAVLSRSKLDMITLWRDPIVREVLDKKRMRLEESSGFFLDEIDRIAARNYVPTEADVLKARLKTLGVVEHSFTLDAGPAIGAAKGVDWKIYDVGGSRNQRHAWAPYFTDVNAIIFLAPISAFDQVLAEDPNVNRLEDSLLLWRALCGNKLLAPTSIVLFLNKCDLLKGKLNSGVRLNTYMTSYGERPNDYESVAKYFRNKFLALHRSYSPNQAREMYIHLTSVIDKHNTQSIILNVRDILLRTNLKNSQLV